MRPLDRLRRIVSKRKITNRQELLQPRRTPFKPIMKDRIQLKREEKLSDYERAQENGVAFVPEHLLPPWRRTIGQHMKQGKAVVGFFGVRVRAVNKTDEPGFPTHFR